MEKTRCPDKNEWEHLSHNCHITLPDGIGKVNWKDHGIAGL